MDPLDDLFLGGLDLPATAPFGREIADTAVEVFEDALSELGEAVTVDGTSGTGIVTALRSDEIIVAGGVADQGGYRVTVPKTDFPDRPDEIADILARGRTMQILSVEETLSFWALICGEVAA